MSIQLVIVCLYIAMLFGISFWVKRRADQGSTEYLLAGRKFGPWIIGVNVTGMAVGAASTVGVAERAFNVGLTAGWYNGAWAIGAITMGLVAAARIRSAKVTTIPEFFEKYYDTKGRFLCACGLAIVLAVIASLQYLAGGAILSALMPDIFTFKSGMLASAVVFIGITLIGGMWSSGLANVVSVVLIYGGILVCCYASVDQVGGWATLSAKVPSPTYMNPMAGLPMAVILGWIFVMMTQTITNQGPVQLVNVAKDAKAARNGYLLAGLMIFPVGFLCAIFGCIARVSYPDIVPAMALPKVIMGLNPLASGVTLAAMWAADVSTACTILLSCGTLVSTDIYKRFMNPTVSEEKYMKVNRLVIICVGALTLWLAFNALGIVKTMLAGLSMTTGTTCVFLFTVFAPQLCRKSHVFWVTLASLVGIPMYKFIPALKVFPHEIYFLWVLCLAVFFVVSALDKNAIEISSTNEEG